MCVGVALRRALKPAVELAPGGAGIAAARPNASAPQSDSHQRLVNQILGQMASGARGVGAG
jgi:hypothetical protein